MQRLLPHEILICGVASGTGIAPEMHYFASCSDFTGRHFSALCHSERGLLPMMMRGWEMRRQPYVLSHKSVDCCEDWRALIKRHGLKNVAAHGMVFSDGSISAFFSFSRLLAPDARTPYLLEILTPFLGDALNRALAAEYQPAAPISMAVIISSREAEVLEWIKKGKTNSEIAQILGLSPATIKNHVQRVLRKLDVRTRGHAVARIIELNIPLGKNS